MHVETIHLKIKQFKCDFCEKSYGFKSHLKDHQSRVHLGEIPIDRLPIMKIKVHQCDVCEKTFSNGGHLIRHKVRIHNAKELTKIKCEICDQRFVENRALVQHQIRQKCHDLWW